MLLSCGILSIRMDPFVNIVPDLHDWILKHFSGKSFSEVTEVSPNWNKILGKSPVMMKTVKLVLNDKKINDWNFEKIIAKHSRRYQNVLLDLTYIDESRRKCLTALIPTEIEIDFLGEPRGKWLYDIDLSKLEILKLRYVSEELVNELLSRCDQLTKLELNFSGSFQKDDSIVSIPIVKSFLERNQNLEDLKLDNPFGSIFFEEDVSDIVKFKLKRLKVKEWFLKASVPENIKRNFLKFLKLQSQSLEKLHIDYCNSNVIEHAFNEMPALTSLSTVFFILGDAQLNLNERIAELTIEKFWLPETLTEVLRVVPNVTKLSSGKLTNEMLEIIASNLPQLRTLRFVSSDIAVDDPVWASLWPYAIPILNDTKYYSWSVER